LRATERFFVKNPRPKARAELPSQGCGVEGFEPDGDGVAGNAGAAGNTPRGENCRLWKVEVDMTRVWALENREFRTSYVW